MLISSDESSYFVLLAVPMHAMSQTDVATVFLEVEKDFLHRRCKRDASATNRRITDL